MTDPIAEIRARHELYDKDEQSLIESSVMTPDGYKAHLDRATLLQAYDSVVAERDKIEASRDQYAEWFKAAATDRDALKGMADGLAGALRDARKAIASLPEDALGYGGSGPQQDAPDDPGDSVSWPLSAELLHYTDKALATWEAYKGEK